MNGAETKETGNERSNTKSWTDIISIAPSSYHIVGLRSDGTVVATGDKKGQCNTESWTNIVAIACGSNRTVGLRSDGIVVSTERDEDYKAWKLFQDINRLAEEWEAGKQLAAKRKAQKKAGEERERRRRNGLCQHCGGSFKGFLSKKCVSCGKAKDY